MKFIKHRVLFICLIPIVILLLGLSRSSENITESTVAVRERQKGVCWVGGRRDVDELPFKELRQKNVQWISQTPFGWQPSHDSPEISLGWRGSNNTERRDKGVVRTTELARKEGIKTILKPHIWLRNADTHWRGDIAMTTNGDWEVWFSNYEKFILHYARLAESLQIEILCIGTELHQTCKSKNENWVELIAKIRKVYSGKLTYAANFDQEYEDIQFWNLLDFIGIQAYFPLSENENPTLAELKEGWSTPISKLKRFSNEHKKPVLFTEIGYKSTKGAAIEPWKWPQQIDQGERKAIYSEETQALCYEAMFQTVWKETWLAGIYLWKWYPNFNQIRARGNQSQEDLKNYFNIDFTPQNKEAEEVMQKWYGLE
ncbi:MAG: hypothetical protein AAFN93_24390 [Bacteroidota bacterium]